jgi:hypothetical protein
MARCLPAFNYTATNRRAGEHMHCMLACKLLVADAGSLLGALLYKSPSAGPLLLRYDCW